jgi:hypothetical protein
MLAVNAAVFINHGCKAWTVTVQRTCTQTRTMDFFLLNPYSAAHVGMLIQPLLIVTLAASVGTISAAGAPKFDVGWLATQAPVSDSDTLGLLVVHYIVHNCLWLVHIWRAMHPEQNELIVPHVALWAILGVGLLTNIVCVLPAPMSNKVNIAPIVDWMFVPVVTSANSFILTRVCWTWLVCAQIIVFTSDWRVKVAVVAWLIFDVTSLLVLRIVTLPALAITVLVAAWAYRRFGWQRTSTGTTTTTTTMTTHSQPAAVANSLISATRPRRQQQQKRINGTWTAAAAASPDHSYSSSSSSEEDSDVARGAKFEIGDATDDIDERRRANAKRVQAVAKSNPPKTTPVAIAAVRSESL